jgi:hypothetical protein
MHASPDHYRITVPQIKVRPSYRGFSLAHQYPIGDLWPVTTASSPRERHVVFQLARYFRREFEYDFIQYGDDGRESDDNHVAFLFVQPGLLYEDGHLAFGACCFRWRKWSDAPASWAMQWIWMHPYLRGNGVLTEAWPTFRHLFGDFLSLEISCPSRRYQRRWKRFYRSPETFHPPPILPSGYENYSRSCGIRDSALPHRWR